MTTNKLIVLACLLAIASARSVTDFNSYLSQLSSRIIGGRDAKEGEFPHQVSLQTMRKSQNMPLTHFCGGSILNQQWILTAAHCAELYDKAAPDVVFVVRAGKHDLTDTEDTEQTVVVGKHFIHEKYDSNAVIGVSPYDIALIKLKKPLQLNKRVATVALPKKNSEPSGKVILSGWGAVDNSLNDPEMPYILQTVNLQIVDRVSCNRAIAKIAKEQTGVEPPFDLVDQTNICSGPTTGGVSACGGDSGGPLISKDSNGKSIVEGIVSWGMTPCGRRGAPSVYARTSYFIDWIENIMANN